MLQHDLLGIPELSAHGLEALGTEPLQHAFRVADLGEAHRSDAKALRDQFGIDLADPYGLSDAIRAAEHPRPHLLPHHAYVVVLVAEGQEQQRRPGVALGFQPLPERRRHRDQRREDLDREVGQPLGLHGLRASLLNREHHAPVREVQEELPLLVHQARSQERVGRPRWMEHDEERANHHDIQRDDLPEPPQHGLPRRRPVAAGKVRRKIQTALRAKQWCETLHCWKVPFPSPGFQDLGHRRLTVNTAVVEVPAHGQIAGEALAPAEGIGGMRRAVLVRFQLGLEAGPLHTREQALTELVVGFQPAPVIAERV